jgi:hypothetical protein
MKKITAQNPIKTVIPVKTGIQADFSGSSGPKSGMTQQKGMTALAALTIMGLFLAVFLALVGTGTLKLPGNGGIPTSPIPNLSDPVEDDEACNDPYNAECELDIENDPENLTPAQIQQELEKN